MRFCATCSGTFPDGGHHICPGKNKQRLEQLREALDEVRQREATKEFVKYDQEKDVYALVPWETEAALAKILTFGSRKYSDNNWQKCKTPWRTYYSALRRHLAAAAAGERIDPDSGEPHLAHALCCLSFLHYFLVNGLLVDAPTGPAASDGGSLEPPRS